MSGGAPEGNTNSKKGRLVRDAIRMALAMREREGRESLRRIVERMIDDAEQGDKAAREELFNRLEGKPEQRKEHTGEDGGDIKHSLTVKFAE